MKKLSLLAIVLLCLPLYAQVSISTEKFGHSDVEGYIVKANGFKSEGTFLYGHPVYMSKEVMFNGTIYKPGELQGFYVDGNYWLSKKVQKEEKFVVCSHYGPLLVYQVLSLPEGVEWADENTGWEKVEYMQKPGEDPVSVATLLLGFKKKMAEFVSDYPELSEKIAKKEKGYGSFNFHDIVKEYNDWYMSNNPEFQVMEIVEPGDVHGEEYDLPEDLLGVWKEEGTELSITFFRDKVIYDQGGQYKYHYEGLIHEYDVDKAFIATKLYIGNSMGYDITETIQENGYHVYYFKNLDAENVEIYAPASSNYVDGLDNIHFWHEADFQQFKKFIKE